MIETIMTRRTIRKYTDKPVQKNIVDAILSAGANAPSAGNQQPWHFVVVTDQDLLLKLADAMPYGKFIAHVKQVIVLVMDRAGKRYPEFASQDCAAAMQNMLLAAHALELGAAWVGVFPDEVRVTDVRKILDVPVEMTPFAILAFGYTDSKTEAVHRLSAEKVHHNKW